MAPGAPMFSVVIPAYNAGRFLPTTLGSVYRQTVQDFEIVVVNDGSTDNTEEILKGEQDPRLRFITRENGGECVARNRGIKEARGKYIALLDADDAWRPNHLEIVLKYIQKLADISWFVTPPQKVAEIHAGDLTPAHDKGCTISSWYLEAHNIPASSSAVVKRELITSIPDIFPAGHKMYGDALGWARLAKRHPQMAVVDAPTVLYRFWNGNASSTHNVCLHGVRAEAVKMALAKQAEFSREEDCPPEARLYFRYFALHDWWPCISTAFLPEEWQADFAARKDVLGFGCTAWLRLWAAFHTLTLRAMRWGSRMCQLSVQRKMQRLAEKTRCHKN